MIRGLPTHPQTSLGIPRLCHSITTLQKIWYKPPAPNKANNDISLLQDIWYGKYQTQIQERVRKVKMKIEEIKTKNQIHKLKFSREGTPVSSPIIEPRHVRQVTPKNVSRVSMKRWKNIQVEEIDGEQFYFCKVRIIGVPHQQITTEIPLLDMSLISD